MRNHRIIAVAYSLKPDAGSEPGAGWMWSRLLATFGETWVLTRTRPPDEQIMVREALQKLGLQDRLHIVDVDLPRWTRVWRVGRPSEMRLQRVEYLLWHVVALGRARTMQRSIGFDFGWHLTWANTVGSLVAFLGIPFVLGPIGGGVKPPWRMVGDLGIRGALFEVVRALAQHVNRHANPVGRRTWEGARFILVQNPETRNWLPGAVHPRTFVFPNAVLESVDASRPRRDHQPPRALFAGWLLPLKGVSLAIRTIALLPSWQLTICGDGPDGDRLRSLARRLGVADRVTFLGWQPRDEVMRLMREDADVFLFPSLHDEGSWVTAEALAVGLPVICIDRGGPPVLGGHGVHATTRRATVRALAKAVSAIRGQHSTPPAHLAFDAKRAALAELLVKFDLLGSNSP